MFTVKVICKPVSVNPYAQANYPSRLEIYNRKNSEFNRLTSYNIDYSLYNNIIDRPPKNAYNYQMTTTTPRVPYQKRVISNEITASETYGNSIANVQSDYRQSRLRKHRPCIPVHHGSHSKYRNNPGGSGRTLWDLNFYFLGYTPNKYDNGGAGGGGDILQSQYDAYGGYECVPNPHYKPHHHGHGFGSYGSGVQGDYSQGYDILTTTNTFFRKQSFNLAKKKFKCY